MKLGGPAFNIEGELVINVDSVERWLTIQASVAVGPDRDVAERLAERWTDDMNAWVLHLMERAGRA